MKILDATSLAYRSERRLPIAISIIVSFAFVGLQVVIWLITILAVPAGDPTVYTSGGMFVPLSLGTTVLLLAFVLGDLHRHRMQAHGVDRFQYVTFGGAALLLVALLVFFIRVWMTVS